MRANSHPMTEFRLNPSELGRGKMVESRNEKTKSSVTIYDVIKPLYYVSFPTCQWPYKYGKNNEISPLTAVNKIYALIFVTALLLYYCLITITATVESLKRAFLATTIIQFGYALTGHALGLLSIFLAHSKTGELTLKFYLEIEDIRKQIAFSPRKAIYEKLRKVIFWHVVLTFGASLVFLTLNMTLEMTSFGYENVIVYGTVPICEHQALVIFLMIHFKAEILLRHFRYVNGKLANCLRFDQGKSISTSQQYMSEFNLSELKSLCRLHGKLCSLVQTVNESHGWEIVLIFIATVVMLLNFLYAGATISEQTKFNKANMEATLYVWKIGCISFCCVILVLLAAKCSKTTEEIKKSGLIASDALLELDVNDSVYNKDSYKNSLQLLIAQINFRDPHFAAAGDLFKFDFTMISMMLGAVVSYFIVFLQFRDVAHGSSFNSTFDILL